MESDTSLCWYRTAECFSVWTKTKRRVNWVLNKNCAFNIFSFNVKDQLKFFPLFSNKHNKIKRVEKRKLHKSIYTGSDQKTLRPVVNLSKTRLTKSLK